jgi:hypothetical protein
MKMSRYLPRRAASLAAAFLYVVSPGPAFLALFTLAPHAVPSPASSLSAVVGDVGWGALAVNPWTE